MASKSDQPKKKPYHSPELKEYGDVRELTEAAGNRGATDGAAYGTVKTQ
jgi:hypothetical protein